jgi:EAL domain-containing protein (putative c-di-GMP-specific phosphodiesterase class I)
MTSSQRKTFKAGDTIIQQGQKGDSAYIIESGRVEILIEKDQGLVQSLGTRGEGSIIGEMAIIDNEPRTASVKALEDSELLEITRQDFERRLKNADPVMQMITMVILTRYRDTIQRAHILGSSKDNTTPEDLEKNYVSQTSALESIKIGNEFKDALKTGQISLHYQPIIDINSAQIIGFEALMRWSHPEKGDISPNVFIPAIEENGFILEASQWALKEACQALKRLQREINTDRDLFMSVNFSSIDITEPGFKSYLHEILDETRLKPEQIHIEITERLLMEEPERSKNTLQACRDMGACISIDDFGTGYSSLSYLHYFPINILKIDRSFVKNMVEDENALELVKSIIALCQNMKLKIIAEGIETKEQIDILKAMNCDCGQGYYIARPMPESEAHTLLLNPPEIA